MLSLGVDFGSTYSSVSSYREDRDNVEPMIGGMGTPYIPSVVSVRNNVYEFGTAAKNQTGRKNVETYKGFKMLLPDSEKNVSVRRGYTRETPEEISARFLKYLLEQAIEYFHDGEAVDHVVVGVPEIWFQNLDSIDARMKVKKICEDLPFVRRADVVSEPAAACAFFAYNFMKNDPEQAGFDGTILLIDYGGGTLDITLTSVSADENEESRMQIKVLERTGAGENEEGNIGNAGIVFMENTMLRAVLQADDSLEEESLRRDAKFYRAVDDLEEEIISRSDVIRDIFNTFGTEDMSIIPAELKEFTVIEYRDEEISITYELMRDVYMDTIYPVLDRKLDEMIRYMEEHRIPYGDRGEDSFKIALVGGFGNFCLVENQVEKKFRFNAGDRRRQGIIYHKGDRQNAISLGAALLAKGIIGISNTAPYSIGIYANDRGRDVFDFAFRYRDVISFDKPYFPMGSDGVPIVYFVAGGSIEKLVFNMSRDPEKALIVKIREEFRSRLARIVDNETKTALIGFSLNSSEMLSLHVRDYDTESEEISMNDKVIELPRLGDLLEPTRIRR